MRDQSDPTPTPTPPRHQPSTGDSAPPDQIAGGTPAPTKTPSGRPTDPEEPLPASERASRPGADR